MTGPRGSGGRGNNRSFGRGAAIPSSSGSSRPPLMPGPVQPPLAPSRSSSSSSAPPPKTLHRGAGPSGHRRGETAPQQVWRPVASSSRDDASRSSSSSSRVAIDEDDPDDESPVALSAPLAAIPPFPEPISLSSPASSSSSSSVFTIEGAALDMRREIDRHRWPRTLIYRGDASGDLTQVVTALTIDDKLCVAVIPVNASGKHRTLYDALVSHYGFGPERVCCLDLRPGPDPMEVYKRLERATRDSRFVTLADCTKIIAGFYRSPKNVEDLKKRDLMRRRPAAPGENDEEIELFNAHWARFLGDFWNVCDRDVAVLWGRRSGMMPGGAHPEYDHSTRAMESLARMLIGCGFFVVFAGDFNEGSPLQPADPRHFALIGSFWKLGDGRPDMTYPQQARFFHMLKWKLLLRSHFMIHVGMRSGTMERMAMSNFATLYIVNGLYGTPDTGDPDNRLEPLVRSMHDRYLFRRVQLKDLPKRSRNSNWKSSAVVTEDLLREKMMLSAGEIANVQAARAARMGGGTGDLLFLLSMIENVRRELMRKLASKAGRLDFFDKHPAYRKAPGFLMAGPPPSFLTSPAAAEVPEGKEEMVPSSSSSSSGYRPLSLPPPGSLAVPTIVPSPLPRVIPSTDIVITPSSSGAGSKRGGHGHWHGRGRGKGRPPTTD